MVLLAPEDHRQNRRTFVIETDMRHRSRIKDRIDGRAIEPSTRRKPFQSSAFAGLELFAGCHAGVFSWPRDRHRSLEVSLRTSTRETLDRQPLQKTSIFGMPRTKVYGLCLNVCPLDLVRFRMRPPIINLKPMSQSWAARSAAHRWRMR